MAIRDLIRRERNRPVTRTRRPFTPFSMMQNEMAQMMEDFFNDWSDRGFYEGLPESLRGGDFIQVDVSEDKDTVEVAAELPGLTEKDIHVYLPPTRDQLTIRGEKKVEHQEKDRNYYKSERTFGSFQRVIPLPAIVDDKNVSAKFKNGVLTVQFPKSKEIGENVKQIEVKGG